MKGAGVVYGHRCAVEFTHTHYSKDMDKNANKDVLGQMLQDWCQTSLDTDPRYDDGDDSMDWDETNDLDWGYDLEELEWNPHYECEDDDPNIEEDW